MKLRSLVVLGLVLTMAGCAGGATRSEVAENGYGSGKLPAATEAVPAGALLSDEQIKNAITAKIFRDPYVAPQKIDVDVADGVVTLKGTVVNLRARERTLNIVSGIRGVLSIVNLLNVQPISRSDRAIRIDVVRALELDPTTESGDFDIKVEKGVVQLSGKVQTWPEKSLAEWVAAGVRGVKAVENETDVEYPLVRPSAEIQNDIQGVYRSDPWINERQIRVFVEGDNVVLSGVANSLFEELRAYHQAWVYGVESVNAEALIVRPMDQTQESTPFRYSERADVNIENAVRGALERDPRISAEKLTVVVTNGVVRLSGKVSNLAARRAAATAASNTTGVWRVDNRLRVVDDPPGGDRRIASDVRSALALNTEIAPESVGNIIVGVSQGVVDTRAEHMAATTLAFEVGARAVINGLQVRSDFRLREDREVEELQLYLDDYQTFNLFPSELPVERGAEDVNP